MTLIAKLVRAVAVSATTTVLSLSILFVLTRFAGVAPAAANVIATVAGIGPSYALNRRFVWKLRGRSRFVRQVLPFWIFSVAGLVTSTVAVDAAARYASIWTGTMRSLVLLAANAATFGSLWIAQFVLLDRVIFTGDSQEGLTSSASSEPILSP
jgi:putative flippase GtrA